MRGAGGLKNFFPEGGRVDLLSSRKQISDADCCGKSPRREEVVRVGEGGIENVPFSNEGKGGNHLSTGIQ